MNNLPTVIIGLLLLFFTTAAVDAQPNTAIEDKGPESHILFSAMDITWEQGPASLEAGAEMAVLEGDPSESGVFTMRLKLPDGYQIAPHSHPNVERVTVISGRFMLGSGEQVDPERTEQLDSGSYTSMPPEMVHYAIAKGETVIQLTSVGPWIIEYVNEEDDPRSRE